MASRLVIIGAGGHSKVVADIASLTARYSEIIYLDDERKLGSQLNGGSVAGRVSTWHTLLSPGTEFFVALGSNAERRKLIEMLSTENAPLATLVHPHAVVAQNVQLGEGTLVVAGAVINADTTIGRGCIVNTNSSVDHDCKIDDYVHVGPGSCLAGEVSIGRQAFVGIGAVVIQKIQLGAEVTVGAGAVVVKPVADKATVVGCPAKPID